MAYQDGLKQANIDLDPLAALRSPIGVLVGVQEAVTQSLGAAGIVTVLDLAVSPVFAVAAAAGSGQGPDYPLGAVPGDLVVDGGPSDLEELAGADLSVLRAFPEPSATNARQAMQVDVIGDLGRWAPYRAALEILAAVATAPDAGASAATELVPRLGQYPTERRFYSTIVLDEVAAKKTVELTTAGPVDLSPTLSADFGFSVPAVGARLTFEQSWFAQGLALGNLLHSLALAPGESTRIAVLDWSRQSATTTTEAISETEQLTNVTTHNRAVSEVQDAVAKEVQSGFSHAESTATTEEGGGGFGLALGPVVIGGAGGAGHSTTSADSFSSSSGSRSLAATMSQKVMDATQQAASSARDRRASIVQEVSQQEQEQVSTRIVANYNHMHALTVQYFEVVELYRVAVSLSEAERCLFVPMKILEFTNAVVLKYQGALADAALDRQVRELLTTEFGSIRLSPTAPVRPVVSGVLTAVTGLRALDPALRALPPGAPNPPATPAGPGDATPPATPGGPTPGPGPDPFPAPDIFTWDRAELDRVARITSSRVVRVGDPDVYLSQNTTLVGLTVTTSQPGPVVTGVSLALNSGQAPAALTRTSVDWQAPGEVTIEEIAGIAVTTEGQGDFRGAMTLELNYLSSRFPVTLPVTAGPNATTTVLTFGGVEAAAELLQHLNANRLHYNQAVWRSLDPSTAALLLSGFQYEGQPVANLIDPTPLQIAANYLVFRMPGFVARRDLAESAEGAATGAEAASRAAWRKWLDDKGLVFGPQTASEQLVPVPTGGVFAEAVLGRSNAAEKLDATRFWNWQDSPIPLQPPEIAAISMESRAQAADVRPGELGTPVLNIVNPTSLPDPTGVGAIIGAVQNGNMFRDMSGLAATIGLAQATGANATSAASDAVRAASANLQAEAQRDVALRQIDAQTKSAVTSPSAMGGSPKNISEMGSLINAANAQDRMSGVTSASRPGSAGGGSVGLGAGTGGPVGGSAGAGPMMPGTSSGSLGTDAFNRALWGAYGAPMSDVVLADFKKQATTPAVSPFRTGLPDRLTFDSKLWDAFSPHLPDLLNVNPGFAGLEDAAMVIVALPDNPADPHPTVGHRAYDMFYSGSLLKVAAMYAAYQLRAAVRALGPSLKDGTDKQVFDQVRAALDAQIRAAVPRIAATKGITQDMLTPRYEQVFSVQHGSPISFDFVIGPDDADPDDDTNPNAKPASTFYPNLRRMIVGSHNNSAGVVIRGLGYNTINGALQNAGFFRDNTQNGIWLAGDYNQWPTVTIGSVNDQQVKQVTTCQDMARLLVLINDNDLVQVDSTTFAEDGNLIMGGFLHLAVTDSHAPSLLVRPFDPNPAPFTVLQSKIGVGELKGGTCGGPNPDRCTYSEAAVVRHSSGRKFIVVWQNLVFFAAHPDAWSDGLQRIANVVQKTMDDYHP